MARKQKDFIVETEGRDQGKQFLITEMDAESGEWWAFRVLQALAKGGMDIGDVTAPAAELASRGFQALSAVPPEVAKPLFDEMMQCVQFVAPDGTVRKILKGDIEEISTRIQLRMEILNLHLGFFTVGGNQI